MIGLLFMKEEQRSEQLNYPPKTHRRTARSIREWIRMGKQQQKNLMDASADIEIETQFDAGETLCWNGSPWEERAVDDDDGGPSSVHQHPMPHNHKRDGCPGFTLHYIQHHHSVSLERAEKISEGYMQACRMSGSMLHPCETF